MLGQSDDHSSPALKEPGFSGHINKAVQKCGLDIGGNKAVSSANGSAKSAADALCLRTTLSFQAADVLNAENQLTQQALQKSQLIKLKDGVIQNKAVVEVLTKDGSNIIDWKKYTTPTVVLPNGQRVQIHYYRNDITGRVDYMTKDFKVKGDVFPW